MALARVVSFEGVSVDRIEEIKREMRDGERPEGLLATEVVVLHDEGGRSGPARMPGIERRPGHSNPGIARTYLKDLQRRNHRHRHARRTPMVPLSATLHPDHREALVGKAGGVAGRLTSGRAAANSGAASRSS